MQVLKDEMRNRIYEAAIKEFSEKGFVKASMRDIAVGAGMTVGNLYRYFEGKEALFYAVIGPAYDCLMELVEKSVEMVKQRFDTSFFEFLSEQILKISKEHKIELLILFEGSGGTKYESIKEEIVSIVEDFLKGDFLRKFKGADVRIEDTYLLRVIAVGFVEGMTMINKKYEDAEKLKKVASQFIAFYFSDIRKRFR
ncbi:MAG TPA: TetR/AcrR family transcriptional regulator [Bacillota bacterium]|nr:TetR/AcrR family transcriptional regulator [Bacillota bacterium]